MGLKNLFGIKQSSRLDSKVLGVEVKNCCNSWRVWLNVLGDNVRIAWVDFDHGDNTSDRAKKTAEDYAVRVRKFFNVK